jgi:hypothetical protein
VATSRALRLPSVRDADGRGGDAVRGTGRLLSRPRRPCDGATWSRAACRCRPGAASPRNRARALFASSRLA